MLAIARSAIALDLGAAYGDAARMGGFRGGTSDGRNTPDVAVVYGHAKKCLTQMRGPGQACGRQGCVAGR